MNAGSQYKAKIKIALYKTNAVDLANQISIVRLCLISLPGMEESAVFIQKDSYAEYIN